MMFVALMYAPHACAPNTAHPLHCLSRGDMPRDVLVYMRKLCRPAKDGELMRYPRVRPRPGCGECAFRLRACPECNRAPLISTAASEQTAA